MACPPPYGMPICQPPVAPCGPQACFGTCCLNVQVPPPCSDPRSINPCCVPIPCEPPQMMVAYRRPYSNIPGKEEYICYPCYFKCPKPCFQTCCNTCPPPQPFSPKRTDC